MKNYDVVVCGGGIAGCAAALAAARRGKKTLLLEKTVFPGGLATSGLVLVYLPLCDGKGRQVTFGIAEELMRASNRYGPEDVPEDWRKVRPDGSSRLMAYFSPASFVLALDELLTAESIDIWYDTVLIGCGRDGQRVRSCTVANKSGIIEIGGEVFIDATGDSDLAHMAGVPCHEATNAMVTWVIERRKARPSSEFTFGGEVSTGIMADSIYSSHTGPGVNGKMVSDFLLEGRRRYREALRQAYETGKESRTTRYPLALPSMVPLRHTRCIRGKFMLDTGMEGMEFEDSVGLAADWRCSGPVWEIPYRSLLPENMTGLLAAGRCVSAKDDGWEITRVIPAAAMTGEVAGVAAALSLDTGVTPDALPYQALGRELREKCGFPLTFAEISN